MPEDFVRRLDTLERNLSDVARMITSINSEVQQLQKDIDALKLDQAVNIAYEKARAEDRKRMEDKINGVYKLGWWVLATFGTLSTATITQLLVRGFSHG